MAAQRPFRFSALQTSAPSQHAWADVARKIEGLGYDILLMADHFGWGFAPMLALHAAALATTTLRVGTTVFDNDFRHPALLANEAATLDVLTDGRSEFGIGAGWNKREYDATGIPFDPPGTRVDRLIEAVSIIKRLWQGETVEHEGEHYTIRGLSDPVRPVQQPHPPIFMGGGGKRSLSFAAREADTVGLLVRALPTGGIGPGNDESEEALARKLGWVKAAAGERFEQLELALLVWTVVTTDRVRSTAETLAADLVSAGREITADEVLASPSYLIGSVESIADRLLDLRDRFGISYFSVFSQDVDTFAQVVARLKGR